MLAFTPALAVTPSKHTCELRPVSLQYWIWVDRPVLIEALAPAPCLNVWPAASVISMLPLMPTLPVAVTSPEMPPQILSGSPQPPLTVIEPLTLALSETDTPASAEKLKLLPPSLHESLIWPPTRKVLISASTLIEAEPLYFRQGLPSLSQPMLTSMEPLALTFASSRLKLPTLRPSRALLMALLIGLVAQSGTLILTLALLFGSHLHCS